MTDTDWNIYSSTKGFTPDSTNGFKAAVPTTELGGEIVKKLLNEGYVKVRPLVVFPS